MSNGNIRKATDVLLDIESKVDVLLGIVRSQDLVIKILSNKLSDTIARLDKQQSGSPRITVEAVQPPIQSIVPAGFTNIPAGDPERNIPFVAESRLTQTDSPDGFRRNSRPETYVQEKATKKDAPTERQMPIQMPPNMPSQSRQDATKPAWVRSNGDETANMPAPVKTLPKAEPDQQMALQ